MDHRYNLESETSLGGHCIPLDADSEMSVTGAKTNRPDVREAVLMGALPADKGTGGAVCAWQHMTVQRCREV